MKAQITIGTDDGVVYTGEMELFRSLPEARPRGRLSAAKMNRHASPNRSAEIDFELPVRPFIKKYSSGMTGPRRLTLLVARIAEGDVTVQVHRAEASRLWDRMTSLMGGPFNSAYEIRARDNGWIGSPKRGVYTLLPGWREVLSI